jgi:hypothetical protein
MERGFVISVVLILAVAMFAGNLNSDNDISGMQVSGGEDEETCEDKCAREKAQDDATCMLDFYVANHNIEQQLIGCEGGAAGTLDFCHTLAGSNLAEVALCLTAHTSAVARCKDKYGENGSLVSGAQKVKTECEAASQIKYDVCMDKCNNGKKETKAPMQIN